MSNYRRLISYIYAYESGVKGKNIGYAKIEVRGEQCRIYVNVRNIYMGGNDTGVYLLTPRAEIRVGRIFIRGGCGEFRVNVNAGDIEKSGYNIEECYGLTVHDVESAWQSYTTVWEDAVAHAAEIDLADVTAENVRRKEEMAKKLTAEKRLDGNEPGQDGAREEQPEREPMEQNSRDGRPLEQNGRENGPRLPISEEIERELEREEEKQKDIIPWEEAEKDRRKIAVREEQEGRKESAQRKEVQDELQETAAESVSQNASPQASPEPSPQIQDRESLEELDRREQADLYGNSRVWSRMQRRYAKVRAFDYENGCEILLIKPQDIGLLPREIWVYGNNSFLLHGYYNYRHLILARLENPHGEPGYLLGVPGHYFSNEKNMAAMFGFPYFVLAKKQPDEDGRFGYWYANIRL